MTNHSKKRKFLATTLTASMVAAAVAPVAGVAAAENSPFPDVPVDHNYAGVITDMVNAGVIEGLPNGNFDLGGTITRAQAAQMVAGLLDLKVGEEENTTKFEDVKGNVWYTGAINSLVDKGIVKGKTDTSFEPGANITRGELAQLLVVAYGLEDVNVDNVELPFTDVAEDAWFAKPIKILYSEGLIKGQTATTFGPKADMKRGDFTWLAANVDYEHGTKLPKPEEEEVALEVESVSAINPKVVTVEFNTALESLTNEEVSVKNAANGLSQNVESVELAEDGLSATVTFYSNLISGTSYNFDVAGATYTYEFAVTEAAEIVLEDQIVEAGIATDLEYTVYDANGIDITKETSVEFVSPSSLITETGVATLPEGLSTTVKVVYTDKDGKKVESATATITGVAAEPVELSNYTVVEGDVAAGFDTKNYKQNLEVYSDDTPDFLRVEFTNQFGDKFETTLDQAIIFESLDTGIAVVDKTTGEIKAFETGTLPVKVSVVEGDEVLYTETVSLEVFAKAELTSIELGSEKVNLSSLDDTIGVENEISFLDQYGNDIDTEITADNLEYNQEQLDVAIGDGKLIVKAAATATEGTYPVKVTVGDLTAEFSVDVKKPGAFAGYEVKGLPTTLDKNADETSTTVSVVAVDANGLFIQEEEAATVVVTAEDGTEITGATIDADVLAVGTYDIEVSLEDKVLEFTTFEVVDTTELPTVTFTSSTLEDVVVDAAILDELIGITNISGEQVTDSSTVLEVKFVSADGTVVSDETGKAVAEGETTIYVTTLVIDINGDTEGDLNTDDDLTVKLDSPEAFSVKVVPAP